MKDGTRQGIRQGNKLTSAPDSLSGIDRSRDSIFAGRAYAAYGGIYITTSLVSLWIAEDQRPTATDLVGATVAVVGAPLIIGCAPKTP